MPPMLTEVTVVVPVEHRPDGLRRRRVVDFEVGYICTPYAIAVLVAMAVEWCRCCCLLEYHSTPPDQATRLPLLACE